MNNVEKAKVIDTLSDYMSDETRVSPAERERINLEISLIGKMVEARDGQGLQQRALAELA